jgi:CRP/FNR family transcriptional regulator, cyclic AMP receptor protein
MSKEQEAAERLLARALLFSALPPGARASLATSPRVKLARDEALFSAGDPAHSVYLVLDGEIALEIDGAEGKCVCVAIVGAGGVFGELGALDGQPRSVGARAAQATTLLSIRAAAFLALIRGNPEFALAIAAELAGKLRRTNAQISGLTFHSLRSRVAGLLDALAAAQEVEHPSLPITQTELAARLAASREKVNGHLQVMQSAGAIRLGRARIDIVDRRCLQRFSDQGFD